MPFIAGHFNARTAQLNDEVVAEDGQDILRDRRSADGTVNKRDLCYEMAVQGMTCAGTVE